MVANSFEFSDNGQDQQGLLDPVDIAFDVIFNDGWSIAVDQ